MNYTLLSSSLPRLPPRFLASSISEQSSSRVTGAAAGRTRDWKQCTWCEGLGNGLKTLVMDLVYISGEANDHKPFTLSIFL